jgi:hypothetical protein
MVGMDSYMNKYLDRRMKALIEEWDLGTKNDLGDFEDRLVAVEEGAREIGMFEINADVRMDELEERLNRLKEAKK